MIREFNLQWRYAFRKQCGSITKFKSARYDSVIGAIPGIVTFKYDDGTIEEIDMEVFRYEAFKIPGES